MIYRVSRTMDLKLRVIEGSDEDEWPRHLAALLDEGMDHDGMFYLFREERDGSFYWLEGSDIAGTERRMAIAQVEVMLEKDRGLYFQQVQPDYNKQPQTASYPIGPGVTETINLETGEKSIQGGQEVSDDRA